MHFICPHLDLKSVILPLIDVSVFFSGANYANMLNGNGRGDKTDSLPMSNSLHTTKELFEQTTDVIDKVMESLLIHKNDIISKSLINTMSILPPGITSISNACLDKQYHHRSIARICGSFSSESNLNGRKSNWWIFQLVESMTLDICVLSFRILSSSSCRINYLEMHKLQKLAARNVTSRYCGSFPAWNESSPMSQLSLHFVITWPSDRINFSLRYSIRKSLYLVIYHGRHMSKSEQLHSFMLQHLGYYKAATYLKITAQYDHIIMHDIFANETNALGNLVIHDGAGTACDLLPRKMSSSHQLYISFFLMTHTQYHRYFHFFSMLAPGVLFTSHVVVNTSSKQTYYSVIHFTLLLKHNRPFEFELTQVHRYGFTGSHCEYSGIILSNTIDDKKQDYGPFCGQHRYESYSITGLRLPIHDAHVILYSYLNYSEILVEIRLQISQTVGGDLLPLWFHCGRYVRYYGQILCTCNTKTMTWKRAIVPSLLYLLPEWPTDGMVSQMTLILTDVIGVVSAEFLSNSLKFCNTTFEKEVEKYRIMTNCGWMDPIVIMKRDFPMDLQVRKENTHVVPYSDMKLMLNFDEANVIYNLFVMKQRETAFSYISIQKSSCTENVTLSINTKGGFSHYLPQHEFLVGTDFEWLSEGNNLNFDVRLENTNHSCGMKIFHQSHDYPFCMRDWYNISALCYRFWLRGGKGLENPLCNEHRCYTRLDGGQLSWNHAQEKCEGIHGSLISINSHEELDLFRMMLYSLMPLVAEKTFIQGVVSESSVGIHFHN